MNDSVFVGLPVNRITPNSPADKAGVHVGDTVVLANGQRIERHADYIVARQLRQDCVELTVLRGNQMLEFSLQF